MKLSLLPLLACPVCGKDLEFAALDSEAGGTLDILISGALLEVQRTIAFLHTTGLSVSPVQRSVSDNGNL